MSQTQLDSPQLHSSLASDPLLCEMVELFVDEMPGRVARLREFFEASDWDGLRRAAHQMKGSVGSYGFDQLTPYAAELESRLNKHAGVEQVAIALEALVTQCGRVTAAAI